MDKIRVYLICSASLLCLFLFGGLLYAAFTEPRTVTTAVQETSEMPVIVIDAGHGGEDGGAGANGVLEKDVNLAIALRLRDMLTVNGCSVVMTRDSDISIYDSSADTTREKKVADLNNRVKIINSSKNNILVSIHQNKFEQSKYSGAQIFYSENVPQSFRLAEEIRRSVTCLLQPENKRELKPADKSIFILSKAEVPAVIVECGFLSNEDEAKKLSDEEYQKQMAFAVFCGIKSYIRNNKG